MNLRQTITLLVAALNLALMLLFPPFDSYSIANSIIPIFAGFHYIFNEEANETINSGVLFLEVAVVLINAGVAWLLLQSKNTVTFSKINYQDATLAVMAVNLVVILLFPPFESHSAVTYSILPTFQGFFFIFAAPQEHVIVTALLYIEVIFMLVNGGLLWLLFKERKLNELMPEEALDIMHESDKQS